MTGILLETKYIGRKQQNRKHKKEIRRGCLTRQRNLKTLQGCDLTFKQLQEIALKIDLHIAFCHN
jgi:hypothetical protein